MERFWEVDASRGLAVIMMLVSNFITDLQFFANYAKYEMFWQLFAIITAAIFVFLVGLSLNISHSRAKKEGKLRFSKFLSRGTFIFALGAVITVVTYFFLGTDYVRFGVLHLIGLSIILAYPFLNLRKGVSLVSGIAIVSAGLLLSTHTFNTSIYFLGMTSADFSSVDYFPIFPWFGVVLFGLYFGKRLYKGGERNFALKQGKGFPALQLLGRNSLLVYFIHQPIFIGILYLLGFVHL
jgi:uncharacterized membrane protein